MHTFQDMILRLTNFWANHGCLFHQCYDLETGAATFNPITFLKALGPEPYNAAYVEPCRRPQDGRYGQNPNRLQLFHQFQVILKPSPENVLDLYLESLKAIGFDLTKHDIRFVHDDWESPTLGAWGLGWEVWIDGMEVTQFTYFQSVAGFSLKPVTAEIAYGLERLSMLLQNKTNLFDMQYNQDLSFRDVIMQNEIEWSTYNFEKSDPKMWFEHFDSFEKEAKRLVECKLPIPAYDFVIKASHAFNMLEARGVISTTERTGNILRIRELARLVAANYIESREVLGFPLLKQKPEEIIQTEKTDDHKLTFSKKETFLLEIGCEMLPANYVNIGQNLLKKSIEDLFQKERLSFSKIETFAAPQRLAVIVHDLDTESKPLINEKKGPLISLAFDANGHLTQQGAGFLKSCKINSDVTLTDLKNQSIPELSILKLGEQDYLFVKNTEPSKKTFSILQTEIPAIMSSMVFPKNMRWASHPETFARPIRWILALLGSHKVPFAFAGVHSSNLTRGHAQYSPDFFEVKNPKCYQSDLKEHYVIADQAERKAKILEQLEQIENQHQAHAIKKERVLNEVVNLVEWPTVVCHNFDSHFLDAPKELLISEMVEHQRYFPLEDKNGKLKSLFVMTLDHNKNDIVLDNNKKVLSARLSDGVFLYHQDLKNTLESYVDKLKTVMFQKDLGTIHQKVERIKHHANLIHHLLKIGSKEKIHRAAHLCKADLVTNLVKEFPELQGLVGKTYANIQGENSEVSEAIYEHWHPNSESGPIPATITGIIISLADKFDNLVGYYSIGLRPTSSSDPYALRRQTLGILKILTQHQLNLNLKSLMLDIFKSFSSHDGTKTVIEIVEFFKNRMKTLLEDSGFKKDSIEAVLSAKFGNPHDDLKRLKALEELRLEPYFLKLLEVYKRLKGQVEKLDNLHFNSNLMSESEEHNLHVAMEKIEQVIEENGYELNYEKILKMLSELSLPLADIFDRVKILCDDQQTKNNRLALLQKAYNLLLKFADFSKIQIG